MGTDGSYIDAEARGEDGWREGIRRCDEGCSSGEGGKWMARMELKTGLQVRNSGTEKPEKLKKRIGR